MAITYKQYEQFAGEINLLLGGERMSLQDMIAILKRRLNEKGANMPSRKKRAMISQPMGGRSDEEIAATREQAIAALKAMGYQVIDTLFSDDDFNAFMRHCGLDGVNRPLAFLAMSTVAMSYCDAVYFCEGWSDARGCVIEHQAAESYGIKCIHDGREGAE